MFSAAITTCMLCSSEKIIHYHTDFNNIKIFKCLNCGVQFMNPQYSNDYLESYYSEYFSIPNTYIENKPLTKRFDGYLNLIEAHTLKDSFLDVGTGNGEFLITAKVRGWNAVGYDVSEMNTLFVERNINIKIFSGKLDEMPFQKKYQVISLYHVIEHLKEPTTFLKKIDALLEDDGILFLGLPNIDALSVRVKFFLEKIGWRKNKVGSYYDTYHHLWYFSPKTIDRLLKSVGFQIVFIKNESDKITRQKSDRIIHKTSFIVLAKKQSSSFETVRF